MTVQRFREFDEAARALWVERGDPNLPRRIRAVWEFARRLAPGAAPRGIRRFRTLEEAARERDGWVEKRALSLRASRLVR